MQRKLRDIPKGEFIGKMVEVMQAENPTLVGVHGRVIDETKNTFVIEGENKETKTLVKKQVTLKTTIDGKEYLIDGKLLQGRPEERLKKKMRI